jgi:uncharacterized damage-inducible protein DinB
MTPTQRAALIQRYQDGPGILEAALAKVPSEALKFRPAPGKWTVHEVIIHCADSETNSHMRIRYLLGEDDALIVGYDQDRWATEFGYREVPLDQALNQLRGLRTANLQLWKDLTPSQLERVGLHSERGPESAGHLIRLMAAHDLVHRRQIDRILAAAGAGLT